MRRVCIILVLVVLLGGLTMPKPPVHAETAWSKWFFVFVEAGKLKVANSLADNWDPDGGGTTFGTVRLSPTGQEPATHYATSTPSTETMRDGITTALSNANWSSLYMTENILLGDEAQWTGPDGWTFTGDLYPAWLAALDDMGLKIIQVPE
jgi:hypothetical protein